MANLTEGMIQTRLALGMPLPRSCKQQFKRLPRLKMCRGSHNEDQAFEVLRLVLENDGRSGLPNRFVARTRVISKTIAAFTNGVKLAPNYADLVEKIVHSISDSMVVRYVVNMYEETPWCTQKLLFIKDSETTMVKLVSRYGVNEKIIMRDTKLSVFKAKLYSKILDHKFVHGPVSVSEKLTVGQWLGFYADTPVVARVNNYY